MGLFTEFLGESEAEFSKEEEVNDSYTEEKKGKSGSDTAYQDIQYKRVPKQNLDYTYINDPQTFGTINRKVDKIMSAGSKITALKKKDQPIWDEFFKRIGHFGQPLDIDEIHEKNFYDKLKYGVTFIEFVFNEDYTLITDLKSLDSRAIDYARDEQKHIVFEEKTQKPLGYAIKIDNSRKGIIKGDELPVGTSVHLNSDEIFLYFFRIAALPLRTFSNGWESIGSIEPSYLSKTRKDKIIEAAVNEAYIAGSSPVYAIVGDNNRRPGKNQKKKTLEALTHIKHSSATVFEYPTEIKALDVKHSEQYEKLFEILSNDQANSLGYYNALMNSPSDTPRSALKQMKQDLDISEQSVAKKYVKQFNKQILYFISKVNGWGEAILEWGDIPDEDATEKAKLLLSCVGLKVLSPQQTFEQIKKIYNLSQNMNYDNTLLIDNTQQDSAINTDNKNSTNNTVKDTPNSSNN